MKAAAGRALRPRVVARAAVLAALAVGAGAAPAAEPGARAAAASAPAPAAGVSQAAGGVFADLFDAARAHDAEYRAARFELESLEQNKPIARAALLPSVGASYTESRVRGERESPNVLGQAFTQTLDYRNPAAALQLRAPLLNVEAVRRYRTASVQVEGARQVFVSRGVELLDRLGGAYAQRVYAEEALTLAAAQVEALQSQSDTAERRYAGGEGTRTEVADAAASLALARVQLIEAGDQRLLSRHALARITGSDSLPLRRLPEDLASLPLPPGDVQAWIELARSRSPGIAARRAQLEAARSEVERARAGHYPRLDLVASAVDARNESLASLNQRSRQYSAGVQLSIPLYAGGGVEAGVTQATAAAARTQADLDNDLEQLALDVRRQFQANQSGQLKVLALNEALVASVTALDGTRRAQTAGFRTAADVLDAVRRVFQARRDLVQARYELLLARLRLLALAGEPTQAIVADMDRHLTGAVVGAASPEVSR